MSVIDWGFPVSPIFPVVKFFGAKFGMGHVTRQNKYIIVFPLLLMLLLLLLLLLMLLEGRVVFLEFLYYYYYYYYFATRPII